MPLSKKRDKERMRKVRVVQPVCNLTIIEKLKKLPQYRPYSKEAQLKK